MLIDAHQHFWRIADRAGQWPPPELVPIYRDFEAGDLQPHLADTGVSGTVLVQSMPTVDDTLYMLRLADHNPVVKGVVGWVNLLAADAPAQITALAHHRKLKGLRPMLQDLPDVHWIAKPELAPAIMAMQAHGLVFDALVLPQHLAALLEFAQANPSLPIVIDHAAKPHIAQSVMDPWRADMAALAALPQVHCKLSGLLTEAGPHADTQDLLPYVNHLFTCFGPERLIWGSDWPVLNLASDYPDWLRMARALCQGQADMTEHHMAAIFGGNARRFYRLD